MSSREAYKRGHSVAGAEHLFYADRSAGGTTRGAGPRLPPRLPNRSSATRRRGLATVEAEPAARRRCTLVGRDGHHWEG